jgi:hypothetical protein
LALFGGQQDALGGDVVDGIKGGDRIADDIGGIEQVPGGNE